MSSRQTKKVDSPDPDSVEPKWHEVRSLLDNLQEFSMNDWTEEKKLLWKQYVKSRLIYETQRLDLVETPREGEEKLVQFAWASRCPDSREIVWERLPSNDLSTFVPVILVFRDGNIIIEEEIFRYLKSHPLLSPSKMQEPDSDNRAFEHIESVFKKVDVIEEEAGLTPHSMHTPNAYSDNPNRILARSADCSDAAGLLRSLLDPEYPPYGPKESLDWLLKAKKGKRFWELLQTAMVLGEMMMSRQILDEQNGEVILREKITTPRGKNAGKEGKAIEQIIALYVLDAECMPSPRQLIKWLGSQPPNHEDVPIVVKHALWTDAMSQVTWRRFQQLVKSAKRRMMK